MAEQYTGQTALGEREYEVWADDSYPPYILLVVRAEGARPAFKVLDPLEGNKVAFASDDYDEVWWWLREDEYSRVEGRTKILEVWEQ